MDKEIEQLASIYYDVEEAILWRIERLPSYGRDCTCNNNTNFSIVEDDHILTFCLNCGGNCV